MNPFGVSGGNHNDPSTSGPVNNAYNNPGWGMDPNMRTPGYDAPYRPAYMGPNPYAAYQRPGFFGAIHQISPLGNSPYWGNPVDHDSAAFTSLASRPMDAAAWVGQRIALPIMGFAAANRLFSGSGKAMGGGLMGGLGEGLGMGSGGVGAMRWAGQAAGGIAAGYFGGVVVTELADKALIQPYIRTRQFTEDIHGSFAGMNMGYGGNQITGRGLSRNTASGIASQLDSAGVRDMTFSSNQYGNIASLGMKAGLFDDVGTKQIAQRMRSIAEQVKALVAISNDPSVQSAVESLAKLRLGGAGIGSGQAVSAFRSMGNYASIAGTSVQHLMNGVGLQGQYAYQTSGLTPYLGQLAAGQAYAGFASAQRSGILSQAQLARMGGLDGATQSSVAGQISVASNPYSQISFYNRFMGKGNQGNMVGNLGAFGSAAAMNPLEMSGNMNLFGSAMTSRGLQEDGNRGIERRVVEHLKVMGASPRGANGKYSAGQIAAILPEMGMSPDQIQAFVSARISETDPASISLRKAGLYSQEQSQARQSLQQYGSTKGGLIEPYNDIRRGINRGFDEVAGLGRGAARAVATVSDTLEKTWDNFTTGNSLSKADSIDMEKVYGIKSKFNGKTSTRSISVMQMLNEDAKKEGPQAELARKIIGSKLGSSDSQILLRNYLKANGREDMLDDTFTSKFKYGGGDLHSELKAALAVPGAVVTQSDSATAMADSLKGYTNAFDNLRLINQAADFAVETAGMSPEARNREWEQRMTAGGSKYAALAEYAAGQGGSRSGTLDFLLRKGLAAGAGGASQVAGGMPSIEDAIRNPNSVSSDKSVVASIRAAGNNRNVVGQILAKIAGTAAGRNIVTLSDGAGTDALSSQMEIARSTGKMRGELADASVTDGDYSSASKIFKNMDEAAKMNLNAATIFAAAVTKIAGSDDNPLWASMKKVGNGLVDAMAPAK